MRKPKDREPKFKKGDKVVHTGGAAIIVSEGWWDQADDFRYEIDFNLRAKGTKAGFQNVWVVKESDLAPKE